MPNSEEIKTGLLAMSTILSVASFFKDSIINTVNRKLNRYKVNLDLGPYVIVDFLAAGSRFTCTLIFSTEQEYAYVQSLSCKITHSSKLELNMIPIAFASEKFLSVQDISELRAPAPFRVRRSEEKTIQIRFLHANAQTYNEFTTALDQFEKKLSEADSPLLNVNSASSVGDMSKFVSEFHNFSEYKFFDKFKRENPWKPGEYSVEINVIAKNGGSTKCNAKLNLTEQDVQRINRWHDRSVDSYIFGLPEPNPELFALSESS